MDQKLPIMVKIQMWRDYVRYIISLQKLESFHLGIELLLSILSIYLLEQDFFPKAEHIQSNHAISIILVLVVFQLVWDLLRTKKEVNEYFNIQNSILHNLSKNINVVPSPKERAMEFETITADTKKTEKIFFSHKINRYIQTTPLTILLSNKKKEKIRKYIEKHKEVLLQYLNYYFFASIKMHRAFTNDDKFCMSSDLSLHMHTVTCHVGGYFDSFLTNQISGTTLVIQDKKHTTISTEEIFPSDTDDENNTYLSDISSSAMNHHIGASTIGFSKDKKMIIWIQGSTNQFGNGLLIPTGSGSANVGDITGTDFQASIKKAMERELNEESTSKKNKNINYMTLLLGFYRWVSRGGKPEFVGITKLPENADFYRPNTQEVHTRLTGKHIFPVLTFDRLPKTIADIRNSGQLSVPLFMCLRELEYMYENHKEELENFLFE